MLQFSGSVCTLISKIFFLAAVLSTPLPVSAQLAWQPTNGPEGGGSSLLVSNDQFAFYPDQYSFYRTQDGLNWERIPMGHIWPMAATLLLW